MHRCVLVAESDELLRSLLVELLVEHGCDVRQAATAEEAIRLALTGASPHVVLLDMNMRDAHEALASLAQLGISVVTMSTIRGPLLPGATEQFDKPFDLSALFALVERYCGPN